MGDRQMTYLIPKEQKTFSKTKPEIITPSFSTLLLDNVPTGIMYGGVITGILGGATLGTAALVFGCPVIAFFFGFVAGYIVSGIVGEIAGFFLLSLPLAIAAQKTRKFLSQQVIQTNLNILKNITNPHEQQAIIENIIREDNKNTIGIRSWESFSLKSILSDNHKTIDKKWERLTKYLDEQSGTAYSNNGKKLFNTALHVIEQHNATIPSCQELQIIYRLLQDSTWKKEGHGFFSNHLPTGVAALKQLFEKQKITSEHDINDNHKTDLNWQMKTIVYKRGDGTSKRSNKTKELYAVIEGLGKQGNLERLQALEQRFLSNTTNSQFQHSIPLHQFN